MNFSNLFNLLNKSYGKEKIWKEVESVFESEGLTMNVNDFYDPFKNLVIGILSQNTNDRNSTKAYIGLVKRIGKITPKIIVKTHLNKIKKAIKPGGLYNLKAKRIKRLSQIILEKYNGDLTKFTKLSEEKAREELLSLPGIGPKTADVFIGYCMKKDTLPIDTNTERVVKRIGIANRNAKYTEMQKALSKILPLRQKLRGHELLIRLGRDFCKVRNPLCESCPIKLTCKRKL